MPKPFRSDLDRPKGRHQFPRAKPGAESHSFGVSQTHKGTRLDRYLASRFPGYSRASLQSLVKDGRVLVDGRKAKPSSPVGPGNEITVRLPEGAPREPEDLGLEIVYRDDWVLAINKRPGLVVHPARGHRTGTVLQGLFHIFREEIERDPMFQVGPAHRIDMGTSGLLLCSWGGQRLRFLQSQFEHRQVRKAYFAIVHGEPGFDETRVDAALGVDPDDRKRVAIDGIKARPARTRFIRLGVSAEGGGYGLLRAEPYTGRMHQIRVHAAHLGHPLVGDELYGGRRVDAEGRPLLDRAALHSAELTFVHPATGEPTTLTAPLWKDMREFLERFGIERHTTA